MMKYFCMNDIEILIHNDTISVCMLSQTSWLFLKEDGTLYCLGQDNIKKYNLLGCNNIKCILSNYAMYDNNKDIKVWLIYNDNQYEEWVCDIDRYIYKENKDLKREFKRTDGKAIPLLSYIKNCISDNSRILSNILIKPKKEVKKLIVYTGFYLGVYNDGGLFSSSDDLNGKRAIDFVCYEDSNCIIVYLLTKNGKIKVLESNTSGHICDDVYFLKDTDKEKDIKNLPIIKKMIFDNDRIYFFDENDNLYSQFGDFISSDILKVSSSKSGLVLLRNDGKVILKHTRGEYMIKDKQYVDIQNLGSVGFVSHLIGYLIDANGDKYKFNYTPEFTYTSTSYSISSNNSYRETNHVNKVFDIQLYEELIEETSDSDKNCIGEILYDKIYATYGPKNRIELQGGIYDIPHIMDAISAYSWGSLIGAICEVK